MRTGRPRARGAPSAGSAEDVRNELVEAPVNHAHEGDDDDNEHNHHGGVRDQVVAARPDDLAQFGDDLAVEEGQPTEGTPLSALATAAGLLLSLRGVLS